MRQSELAEAIQEVVRDAEVVATARQRWKDEGVAFLVQFSLLCHRVLLPLLARVTREFEAPLGEETPRGREGWRAEVLREGDRPGLALRITEPDGQTALVTWQPVWQRQQVRIGKNGLNPLFVSLDEIAEESEEERIADALRGAFGL